MPSARSIPKRWQPEPRIPPEAAATLAGAGYSPLVTQLLYNRGLADADVVRCFLAGELAAPDDPFRLKGVAEAVDRLRFAIERGELVVVYGDYDTDGVTATALLVQVLLALGANVRHYIPDREEEGYGLNVDALRKLKQEAAAVVVTVDCGVRSLAEADAARSLGLDLIITDHHHPGEQLPDAFALINPKQPGDDYPDKQLAGVGLAYKLAQGLIRPMAPRPAINGSDVLDLVALGTVADLAPLWGENRVLVRNGLRIINRRRREGLRALMDIARVRPGAADASTIGFILGPRLNAAGRLESALDAYELLTTGDPGRARELAAKLDRQNRERQRLTQDTHARARDIALQARPAAALLFAADPAFRSGVVGLAASRLSEEFYRPAVVASIGADETRGSARSIREFHITNALDECGDLLERYGGHSAAAGFTVRNEHLPALCERLLAIAERELGGQTLQPTLRIDVDEVPLSELTPELFSWLAQFEPCGYGNPTPLFASRAVTKADIRTVGADGRHLKLRLVQGAASFDAIAFGQADLSSTLPDVVDVAYCLESNEWNGRTQLQLNVRAIQPAA
jgi:single-stranded-DNA-specific exonuclease